MYSAKTRVSKIESVGVPVQGLNTSAPAASMPDGFARELKNWFPGEFSLKLREGYVHWNEGLDGAVETIIPYVNSDGDVRHFAALNSGLFETTTQGDLSLAAADYALTEGRCSYTQITNTGASWLVIVNGEDAGVLYNGTAFTTMVQDATPTNPGEIDGISPANLIGVTVHNRRLWFIEKNSMSAWYLPLESVGGVISEFPLGSVFSKGGKLISVFTVSNDSGEGMDDVLLFLTSQGELAAYMGGNVEDAEEWALSAVYDVSKSYTDRPFVDTTGNAYLLSGYGVLSFNDVLSRSQPKIDRDSTVSKNIYPSLAAELNARGSNANWEIAVVPSKQMMVVMFPPAARPAVQFVMNMETLAWAQYDLPINTMTVVDGILFFGTTDGRVCRYGDIYKDAFALDDVTYDPIQASVKQAYNYFGQKGINKHFNFIKLLWMASFIPRYIVRVATDYQDLRSFDSLPLPPAEPPFALWGEGIWGEDYWATGPATLFRWDGLDMLGYCASLLVRVESDRFIELASTEWAFEHGASL